jgi:hypothetical protein
VEIGRKESKRLIMAQILLDSRHAHNRRPFGRRNRLCGADSPRIAQSAGSLRGRTRLPHRLQESSPVGCPGIGDNEDSRNAQYRASAHATRARALELAVLFGFAEATDKKRLESRLAAPRNGPIYHKRCLCHSDPRAAAGPHGLLICDESIHESIAPAVREL